MIWGKAEKHEVREIMPKVETITIGKWKEPAVNLHFTVGVGGDNGTADVMLIQTMLRYIGASQGKNNFKLGIPMSELPKITGICDAKTQRAIWKFQITNAKHLRNPDGLIHPASYAGRSITPGEKRVMTITLMHYFASDAALFAPEPNYVQGLIKIEPLLAPWLT